MGLMETQAARTDQIRPVIGGIKVNSDGEAATLGFVATDSSGNRGVVTTGHIGAVGSGLYQPDGSGSSPFLGIMDSIGNTYSDSSWTPFTSGITSDPKVYESASTYTTFKYWDDNPSGLTLYKSGVITGVTTGSTVDQSSIWDPHFSKFLQNQWYATYSSSGGDSGSPVYEKYSSGATVLVGIHLGVETSNGYAIFSPVQGIRRDLNWITPLTG
ncbi:MAG: S1 family peptidase [Methanoregula sp.]|nr:S1 family peptidase [Methanoregula sp.]